MTLTVSATSTARVTGVATGPTNGSTTVHSNAMLPTIMSGMTTTAHGTNLSHHDPAGVLLTLGPDSGPLIPV